MKKEYTVFIKRHLGHFAWYLLELDHALMREGQVASGTSPDYDEACRMAKIAWEQHSEAVSD